MIRDDADRHGVPRAGWVLVLKRAAHQGTQRLLLFRSDHLGDPVGFLQTLQRPAIQAESSLVDGLELEAGVTDLHDRWCRVEIRRRLRG